MIMHRGGPLTCPMWAKTVSENTFRADTWAQPQRLGQGEEERREQRTRQEGLCICTARPRDDKLYTENHRQLGSWCLGFILQAPGSHGGQTHPRKLRQAAGGRGRSGEGQAEAATVQARTTEMQKSREI